MTKLKSPQFIRHVRYDKGQRWTTEGRTAFELPYVAVCKEVMRILTEHQQARLPPPTLPWLSEQMIAANAAIGQIVTSAQIARAFRNAPEDLKNDRGRPSRNGSPKAKR